MVLCFFGIPLFTSLKLFWPVVVLSDEMVRTTKKEKDPDLLQG
jgi:hypothetical protein